MGARAQKKPHALVFNRTAHQGQTFPSVFQLFCKITQQTPLAGDWWLARSNSGSVGENTPLLRVHDREGVEREDYLCLFMSDTQGGIEKKHFWPHGGEWVEREWERWKNERQSEKNFVPVRVKWLRVIVLVQVFRVWTPGSSSWKSRMAGAQWAANC